MSCELQTLEDVRRWLTDPDHQVQTGLFVVRWVGHVPYISTAPYDRRGELEDDAFVAVVLREHLRRRTRPVPDDDKNDEREAQ